MISANPYLNFSGTCAEAFGFYKAVFGGEFGNVTRFSDMPADPSAPADPELSDQIMHISLPLGDSMIMGSDIPPGIGAVTPGNNNYVCVTPDSVREGERVFAGLSEGGDVEMAYAKQVWGDYFGSCTDKYGVRWMVDVGDPQVQSEG